MRRRLRDVGTRLAGTRAPARDEATPETADHAGAVTSDTGVAPAEPDAPTDLPSEETAVPVETPPALEESPTVSEPIAEPVAEVAPDAVLLGAVDTARAIAAEVAGSAVGDHLGVEPEGALTLTHSFAALEKGYVGWRWAVTVSRADGHDEVTVDEVVLLPGGGALLAPEWLPWSERIQPGDLSPGDLLPTSPDDPRLVASFEDVEQQDLLWELDRELGLGREKVLSLEGRELAAERWYDGDAGPRSPLAKAAPAPCRSCGFLVPLAGGLAQGFGACANGFAPDDGRVVALDHGCGAHSSVVVDPAHAATTALAVEHEDFEMTATEPSGSAELTEPAEQSGPEHVVDVHVDPAADHADEPVVTPEGEAALPYGHS
ncbi:MAG: DUF3027 domain-containing protein [Mycobacteriales bacterium]|nr:DUF3027 domain-containing protein [Mycobacteriales bacterium]